MNLVVSLHDVHPSSLAAVARQRAELRAWGVEKTSLLVVPQWHGHESIEDDPRFAETISEWQAEGDEIVLHGWTHSTMGLRESAQDWFWTRLYTNREAEFRLATVPETEIRLTTGRELFERHGWRCTGFIAPAWLIAPHTFRVLREMGFAYTVTRQAIVPLSEGAAPVMSTSLCYSTRSGWRRAASRVWNPALLRSVRELPVLRISLHPGDIAYPSVWKQIRRLTESALAQGRSALSYRECVANLAGVPSLGSVPPIPAQPQAM